MARSPRISSTLVATLVALAAPAAPIDAQIEVAEATIAELQEAMASGVASSAEITAAFLARIAAYDQAGPRLNAMIWLNQNAMAVGPVGSVRIADRSHSQARNCANSTPSAVIDSVARNSASACRTSPRRRCIQRPSSE